jgi:hypothetical protein
VRTLDQLRHSRGQTHDTQRGQCVASCLNHDCLSRPWLSRLPWPHRPAACFRGAVELTTTHRITLRRSGGGLLDLGKIFDVTRQRERALNEYRMAHAYRGVKVLDDDAQAEASKYIGTFRAFPPPSPVRSRRERSGVPIGCFCVSYRSPSLTPRSRRAD